MKKGAKENKDQDADEGHSAPRGTRACARCGVVCRLGQVVEGLESPARLGLCSVDSTVRATACVEQGVNASLLCEPTPATGSSTLL